MKALTHYLRRPVHSFKRLVAALVGPLIQGRPASWERDYAAIMEIAAGFSRDGHFDFAGLKLTQGGFNTDLFFNVVYPHISGCTYRRHEVSTLYRLARRTYRSLQFFSQNPLHLVNWQGIVAHGVPYFYESCRVRPGDIVIDVGAAPGDFSALSVFHRAQTVYALDPENSEWLAETARLNGDRIICVPAWLSGPSSGGGALTIDAFARDRSLPRVDFIKIDAEGAEPEILLGAKETIQSLLPCLSVCTYHDFDHARIIRKLVKSFSRSYVLSSLGPVLYAWPASRADR